MSSNQLRQRTKATTETPSPVVPQGQSEVAAREKKKKSIITRVIAGAFMIAFFAGLLLTDHLLVALFVVVLQIIVFKEVISIRYRDVKEKNLWGFRTLHWYLLFCTFFYFYGELFLYHARRIINFRTLDYLHRQHVLFSFIFYVIAFLGFIVSFKKDMYKYQLGQIAWTVFMLLNVVVQSHLTISNIYNGMIWFVLPCALIIINDIAAYFWGMLFGRKFIERPLTSLSPNKTWEGFVGAFFSTIVVGFIISWFLAQFDWFICPKEYYEDSPFFGAIHCTPSPVFVSTEYLLPPVVISALQMIGIEKHAVWLLPIQLHSILFSLFASLIAPFGGFFASAMKRAYGIKDFGTLFPGHGGMTDRMDCQFIMGLFVNVYYTSFLQHNIYDFATIANIVTHLSADDQRRLYDQIGRTLSKL